MKTAKHNTIQFAALLWRHYHGRPHKSIPHKTRRIRMFTVGILMMAIGVGISHGAQHFGESVGFAGDMFGYVLHGLGSVPMVKIGVELLAWEA